MLPRKVDRGFQQFGPFLIVRTLGRGGMGEVFVARTPWHDHPVAAVKRLRPDVARVPTFAERFQHESELAVRLEHQNVVGTLDVGSVGGQLYVASELVLGKDAGIIADRLRERGQGGPAAVAIRLMLDVLTGLAYVHDARDLDGTPLRLVHRDITPGNVLVSYDGIAQLADFGLAKSLLNEKANLTQHGEILGTPHYLAPEIIRGEEATIASDLYGLGAVIYRFLTGVAPHQGATAEVLLKVLSEEPRPLSDLRPDLSSWLVAFVHTLLAKAPDQRPADARALASHLGAEAKSAGLLVPRSAVGRWLGELFKAEKADELDERERLVIITAEDLEPPREGTVVLAARPRSGSVFRAPSTETGDHLGYDDAPAGTELDVGIDPTEPEPAMSNGLGSVVPSDVTDAGQGIELTEIDSMPTRAMKLQVELSVAEDTHDLGEAEVGGVTTTNRADSPFPGSLVRTEASNEVPSVLPGFVDADDCPPTYSPVDTNLDPEGPLVSRARSRESDAVIVSPLAASAVIRPVTDESLLTDRRPEPRRSGPSANGRVSPAPVTRPVRPGPRLTPASATERSAAEVPSSARNLLLLVSMLAVAVLLGVLVGALVVSYRTSEVTVVQPRGPLQEQLFRVQTRLVGRVERGEIVPTEVWSKVTRVHAALKAGDEAVAAALLEELEADR